MNYLTTQHKYYTLDFYLKERFKSKVFKVALNGGFTCPNRDGTISSNGCIFCSPLGSGDFAGKATDSLQKQFDIVSSIIHEKWKEAKYIVYFQAFTNTYAPLNKLKSIYEEAIKLNDNIVAISIATRPDCLTDEVIEYLSDLNKRIPVWIELGLQTIHEETARIINRGYHLNIFTEIVNKLCMNNIEVIVHIINGLPYETKQMMLETIKFLNNYNIKGIKIHSLFVLKNTVLERMYESKEFSLLSKDEYVETVCEQLAWLRKDIVVHRISGDAPKEQSVAPLWSLKKLEVMNEIDKLMKQKHYVQGIKLSQ